MPTKGLAPGQRRRDRDARATLRRLEHQRGRLATGTAQSRSRLEELTAVVAVLRGAASPGAHQIDQSTVDRLLSPVVDVARECLDDLHARQRRRAETNLDERKGR